jgi:RNA polymerase primary sigma factor
MKKSILINGDEIQHYIKDLRKIPVISHERQEEIFLLLQKKDISKTEKQKLFNELVVGNLRFVISVAKGYQNQGLDLLDLISEGNIGLMKASERFDPTSGLKFISYAVWWVRQSMIASLNENARTIRIPSNLVQDAQKEKKKHVSQEDRFYIDDESENTPIGTTLPYCIGLYREINEEGDQLIDVIPNKNIESPDEILNSPEEIKKKVNLMLSVLDDREKTIIERYFGLTGTECNLEDLGEEFGCTKERIRQLRDKAIKKLRNESFDLLNYL